MYRKEFVNIPNIKGKINVTNKGYVRYRLKDTYHKDKGYSVPTYISIGKVADIPNKMYPNDNYFHYFMKKPLPFELNKEESSCQKFGNFIVLEKIRKDLSLDKMLADFFDKEERDLLFDLVYYALITEGNEGATYRSYAYDHATKTAYMDCEISAFMQNITYEVITFFVHAWQKDCHPSITYFIDEGALACDSQGKPLYYLNDDDPAFLKDIAHNDGFDEVSFAYESHFLKMKTYLEADDYAIVSEPLTAKIFIHFLAFILRWGMSKHLGERDVHQAIRTLERISYNTTEKQLLDPLTRSQLNILSCFGMTKEDINY